jgi:hypothetical protein
MLDDGTGPDATPEILGRIVARQRQRRVRHYRVAATTAVVVALVGAGVGVHLDQTGRTVSALALGSKGESPLSRSSLQAPAGLKWDVESADHGEEAAGVSAPGQFGFSTGQVPTAARFAAGVDYSAPASESVVPLNLPSSSTPSSCASKGCEALFSWEQPRALFTRHVDGMTIAVSLVTYDYPVAITSAGRASPPPTPPRVPTSPPAASGSLGTAFPVTAPVLRTTPEVPSSIRKAVIPVTLGCPVASELMVAVSDGSSTRVLFVPTGGMSDHAFSLVASAAASFGSVGSVVLAVARTSPSVAKVSAAFPGGGTDTMAPSDGWVVLAQRVPAGTNLSRAGAADLQAVASSGKALEHADLPATWSLASAPIVAVCHLLVVPLNSVGVTGGSPGSAPGSSPGGSGSTGSTGSAGSKPAP